MKTRIILLLLVLSLILSSCTHDRKSPLDLPEMSNSLEGDEHNADMHGYESQIEETLPISDSYNTEDLFYPALSTILYKYYLDEEKKERFDIFYMQPTAADEETLSAAEVCERFAISLEELGKSKDKKMTLTNVLYECVGSDYVGLFTYVTDESWKIFAVSKLLYIPGTDITEIFLSVFPEDGKTRHVPYSNSGDTFYFSITPAYYVFGEPFIPIDVIIEFGQTYPDVTIDHLRESWEDFCQSYPNGLPPQPNEPSDTNGFSLSFNPLN